MGKKTAVLLMICLTIAVCGAAFFAYNTRPLAIERRFPELDFSQCTQIWGYYRVVGKNDEQILFRFSPDDPQFDEIIDLFRTAGFRTRIGNVFPPGTKLHLSNKGDFQWTVSFRFEEVLSEKGILSGDLLRADNFFGDMEISFDGKQTKCSVKEQTLWLEEVLSLIRQGANE